jgi:hypothetical protein
MYFFDPLYMLLMGVALVLSLGAQVWVMAAIKSQSDVPLRAGLSGAQIAQMILARTGLSGLRIEETSGWLGDHYDPSTRTLRLTHDSYYGRSVAAAGIAAHEAGHAVQHAQGYWPMQIRQRLVLPANIGTHLGVLLIMIGLPFGMLGLAKVGVVIFSAFVLFTLVTLPVELDASARAKAMLAESGVLSPPELDGVGRVLRAAAATYVAAALTAILQLLYFVLRVREREE